MIDPRCKETGYSVYDDGKFGNHWVIDKKWKSLMAVFGQGACAFPDYKIRKVGGQDYIKILWIRVLMEFGTI